MSTKIVDGFSGDLIEPDFSGLDFKFSRMEKAAARDELSLDAIDACIATIKALCEDRGEVLERGKRVYAVEPNDGWITWEGGPCPVAPDVMVSVRLRRGAVFPGRGAGTWGNGGTVSNWSHEFPSESDIVAYRIG